MVSIYNKSNEFDMSDMLNKVRRNFHGAFINLNMELILDRKHNLYFMLNDIESELEFKCKMIEWLSRPSCKGLSSKKEQTRILQSLNGFLDTNFSHEEINSIYSFLGNSCNRQKTIKFIESNYDIGILNPLIEKSPTLNND